MNINEKANACLCAKFVPFEQTTQGFEPSDMVSMYEYGYKDGRADIKAIKAEIERRISDCDKRADAAAENNMRFTLEVNETLIGQYKSLLSFIESLEKEQVVDPTEEAYNKGFVDGRNSGVDDAMRKLEEKIALVKKNGSWDGVDVEKFMDEIRGRE